jgi:hypothetical protein
VQSKLRWHWTVEMLNPLNEYLRGTLASVL